MGDNEEHENTVLKTNRDASDSGLVVSEKTEESWLHKTLESFSSSFDEQQRVQQDVFMRTLHE